MAKQISRGKRWYVIHTYSGYEESVADNLKQRIESMDMEDKIFDVIVPTEKKINIKNGKRKTVIEKIFHGYIFVQMVIWAVLKDLFLIFLKGIWKMKIKNLEFSSSHLGLR